MNASNLFGAVAYLRPEMQVCTPQRALDLVLLLFVLHCQVKRDLFEQLQEQVPTGFMDVLAQASLVVPS